MTVSPSFAYQESVVVRLSINTHCTLSLDHCKMPCSSINTHSLSSPCGTWVYFM
jgi:hypothetical protein